MLYEDKARLFTVVEGKVDAALCQEGDHGDLRESTEESGGVNDGGSRHGITRGVIITLKSRTKMKDLLQLSL